MPSFMVWAITDPLDMLRTVVNVTGDMTVSCVVDEGNKTETADHEA